MESLHYLLMKSHAMLSRRISEGSSALGLTPGQPKVLDFLQKHQEAEQKTIASYCEIQQATVGSILMRMETAGLVIRRQKAGNRRSLYVSLTERGQEMARKMETVFREAEEDALAGLSPIEQEHLSQLLDKLCGTMDSGAEDRREEA